MVLISESFQLLLKLTLLLAGRAEGGWQEQQVEMGIFTPLLIKSSLLKVSKVPVSPQTPKAIG